jgi:hypothetical protein
VVTFPDSETILYSNFIKYVRGGCTPVPREGWKREEEKKAEISHQEDGNGNGDRSRH